MNKISILDCTLRDGGYINNWKFGEQTIREIIRSLIFSGVEIVECGFLQDIVYHRDTAVFSCVSQIEDVIAPKQEGVLYVAMIALGDLAPKKVLPCNGKSIDGIRLTFHKQEWPEAKRAASMLMEKGYRVFIQPVGTTSYSDQELLNLIAEVNALHPFAFYLVDTLGIMYRHDLLRLFYLVEHNLESDIRIGFHSHNNLQLSFANAQELLRLNVQRDIIIDTSVYGMGRGVGNLSTELLAEYINANIDSRYSLSPLLKIADQYLMPIFSEQSWGYSLPYFLSAIENCHPNYASHLLKKETLNIEDISKILSLIPPNQRELYHRELAERLYLEYQNCQIEDEGVLQEIREMAGHRPILLLAPGGSVSNCRPQIDAYIQQEQPFVIAVNFIPDGLIPQLLFISNRKRLDLLKLQLSEQGYVLATSNLMKELSGSVRFVNYSSYLGEGQAADNAGAMLIRILKRAGATWIALAGFDGFDVDSANNYCVDVYKNPLEKRAAEQKNRQITRQLKLALNEMNYTFLTPTRYRLS